MGRRDIEREIRVDAAARYFDECAATQTIGSMAGMKDFVEATLQNMKAPTRQQATSGLASPEVAISPEMYSWLAAIRVLAELDFDVDGQAGAGALADNPVVLSLSLAALERLGQWVDKLAA